MVKRKTNTKKVLVADIIPAWNDLNEALAKLSNHQKALKDAQGWSVKDHLVHLAAWENSVAYLLQGKPRHEGLGIEQYIYSLGDFDVMNDAIQKKNQTVTYRKAYGRLQEVHARLMALIDGMDDASLLKPYRAFLPDEPGEGEGPPVVNLIYSDTSSHFNEHLEWIKDLTSAKQP